MKSRLLCACVASVVLSAGIAVAEDTLTIPPDQSQATLDGAAKVLDGALNKEKTLDELRPDASYAIGADIGQGLKSLPATLDLEQLIAGLRDSMTGAQTRLTPEQMQEVLTAFQTQIISQMQSKAEADMSQVKTSGALFREENAKKAGVVTTASGLQIETLVEGKGDAPKATDTVRVHYTGTLIDGTKFDSSLDRGEPAEFPLSGVIPGWTEGLQLVKPGGKAKLVIPPDLGYGDRGAGPTIPPGATLVFEVELLEIVK
jgi:FKBP-type peptidyl-prolyl cis-trans isomerase